MENRRTRRFALNLPVSVVRSGTEHTAVAGQTKNISSTGVLFTIESEPTITGAIEYVISLNPDERRPLNLHCLGKVVRLERANNGRQGGVHAYHVAATLERYEFVRAG
jgi:hypothetical protein